MRKRSLVLAVAAAAITVLVSTPAAANHESSPSRFQAFRADLKPVPHDPGADSGSAVRGQAALTLRGNSLNSFISARGLSPELPHAMHIHGTTQALNECPSLAADTSGDGLIDTLEGMPDYGPIDVTFSTSGGTAGGLLPDGLDLSRAPMANSLGFFFYQRQFDIPEEFASNLGDLHIVVHGEDLNDNGAYDFEAGTSSLSELAGIPVPLEGELPVACGTLRQVGGTR